MPAFDGEFVPPTVGASTIPLPLVGSGTLEVSADALVARGLKRQSLTGLMALLVVAVLGTLAGTALLLSAFNFSSGKKSSYAAAGAAVVVATVGARLLRKKQLERSTAKGITLELVFEWARVKKVADDPRDPGTVIVHIKRSLLNTESLHFKPRGQLPAELIAAIQQRLA